MSELAETDPQPILTMRAHHDAFIDSQYASTENPMASPAVLGSVIKNITSPKGEGFVSHLYLDKYSYVTIGYGHMMSSADEAIPLSFVNTTTKKPATKDEKIAAWNAVQSISPQGTEVNMAAKSYAKNTTLRIDKAETLRLLDLKLTEFSDDLEEMFSDFDKLPENAQIVLFDMIYNLGSKGLERKFKKFVKAVRAHDWEAAAKESYRYQLPAERNNLVRDLLQSCHHGHVAAAKRTKANGHPVMHRGDEGEDVKKMQVQLNRFAKIKRLASIAEDGSFGRSTELLVKQVQIYGGLKPDGAVGPKTKRILAGL